MANSPNKRSSSSSSNRSSASSTSNVRASAYVVNASTAALTGFHYSTTGAGGAECPPLAARHHHAASPLVKSTTGGLRARRGGAAYTIKEECERLFCETLGSVFLVEGKLDRQDSLVMGVQNTNASQHSSSTTAAVNTNSDYGVDVRYADRIMDSPPAMAVRDMDLVQNPEGCGLVTEWIEMWDYVGGIRFRGFVADKDGEKTMFVFFDQTVIREKIKPGLMALLELCDIPYFSCPRLMLSIDRDTATSDMDALVKDLGWIGFQLTTLSDFSDDVDLISDKWLFMDMET
ncbi:unnamed protein product [Periconia digitata]|uniref:Ornithine decarboxylase antizyme n=1 Tax=Periconia digitata TaxID=1303443 RepID=A0A9W4UGH1_9PLEO|nr:unnamed protein product [Periconia digitata]